MAVVLLTLIPNGASFGTAVIALANTCAVVQDDTDEDVGEASAAFVASRIGRCGEQARRA